jgi:hypothetical protein
MTTDHSAVQQPEPDPTASSEREAEARSIPSHVPSHLPWRLATLIVLILLTQWWLQHHLSLSFWETITGGLIISIILSVSRFVYEGIYGEGDNPWKQAFRRCAVILVQMPTLITFAAALVIVTSSVSTVRVVSEEGVGATFVCLKSTSDNTIPRADDRDVRTLNSGGTVRFVRLTHPFGRELKLAAGGYRSKDFVLRPWRGKRIHIKEDLYRIPTLVVRVPAEQLTLAGGRVVRLYAAGNSSPLAEATLKDNQGSVAFGINKPESDEFQERWQQELEGSLDAAHVKAWILERWQSWQWMEKDLDLEHNSQLHARLETKAGTKKAGKPFTVSDEPFQDILMVPE